MRGREYVTDIGFLIATPQPAWTGNCRNALIWRRFGLFESGTVIFIFLAEERPTSLGCHLWL